MTPTEVLNIAASQFTPLYINDPEQLNSILKRALGVYQDRAGVIKTVKTTGTIASVFIPDDMLSVIFASDKNGRYHEVIQSETALAVEADSESCPPYTFHYFVNLRDYDMYDDLPPGIVGDIIDYVAALIAIPNTDRARAVALSTGRQIELPSNDELNIRKSAIETYMEDSKAIIPMMSVF